MTDRINPIGWLTETRSSVLRFVTTKPNNMVVCPVYLASDLRDACKQVLHLYAENYHTVNANRIPEIINRVIGEEPK